MIQARGIREKVPVIVLTSFNFQLFPIAQFLAAAVPLEGWWWKTMTLSLWLGLRKSVSSLMSADLIFHHE